MPRRYRSLLVLGLMLSSSRARAADPEEIRATVLKGLAVVERAAATYPTNRDCFSCHHQTLPMLAAVVAEGRGLGELVELVAAQAEFTRDSFMERIKELRKGQGIGGRAMTVGYGLLALELAEQPRDDLTEAMTAFLLLTQEEDGSWRTQVRRPPLEESPFACTALALHGLSRWAGPPAAEARDRGWRWIIEASPVRQEDRNARLWALVEGGACPLDIDEARREVLAAQRHDGGWASDDRLGSDAYATGQTLAILSWTGLPTEDSRFLRGVDYLMSTQLDDGSWFVATRSQPVQVAFDNGDPHGRSQFIAVSATAWAVVALSQALPPP